METASYGYSKLTSSLKEDYQLIINHKKVYRLCKELDILRPQRKVYPKRQEVGQKDGSNRAQPALADGSKIWLHSRHW